MRKKTRQIYVALLTSFSQEPKCHSTLFIFWHGFKRLRSDGHSFQKLGQRLHGFVPLDSLLLWIAPLKLLGQTTTGGLGESGDALS